MINLRKVLSWVDDHLLLILASFLLVFIPAWPKIPLFSLIEQYIVRVRLEDILILATSLIWGIWLLRGKIKWRSPFLYIVIAYAVVGALSLIDGMLVIKTIPLESIHVGKSLLHYFRYLEYFSLFFILFSSLTNVKQLRLVTGVLMGTLIFLSIYGFGQKYYYWPVYSTMNREFSKGVRLYLTPHARVQSTFGGHYDLGAYLVIILPIILALALGTKNGNWKLTFHLVHLIGLWLLIVSASRSSFLAYLLSAVLLVAILSLEKLTLWGKFYYLSSRTFLMVGLVSFMMLYFGTDMYERFEQLIKAYPRAWDVYSEINERRKLLLAGKLFKLPEAQKPDNAISTDELEAQIASVLVPSDERPVTVKPSKPSDVYVEVPDIVVVATKSASGAATTIAIDKGPRVYSDNAIKYGLSVAIRLDTLWPQAIKGFWRNPLVGSGYATLNKTTVDQFTEADSTDNNFLRTLGETGLLGFVTFYGAVTYAMYLAYLNLKVKDWWGRLFSLGFLVAGVGLLTNASYIDVYASSKVALTYWALSGVVIGYHYLSFKKEKITFHLGSWKL